MQEVEKYKNVITGSEEAEEFGSWMYQRYNMENITDLHNHMKSINVRGCSTQFLVGVMMHFNVMTSKLILGLICHVDRDTDTRWMREEFAKRCHGLIKERGEDGCLCVFETK